MTTRRARSLLGVDVWIGVSFVVVTLVLIGCDASSAASTSAVSTSSARHAASSAVASNPSGAPMSSGLLDDAKPLESAIREGLAGRAILRIQVLATKAMIESIAPGQDVAEIHLFRDGGLSDHGTSTLKRGAPAIDLSKVNFTNLPRMRRETAAAAGTADAGPVTIEATGITVVAGDRGVGRFDLGGSDFHWEPE